MFCGDSQKIAVIGATGQIGMVLSRELHALGHEVLAISRGVSVNNQLQINLLKSMGIELLFHQDLEDSDGLAAKLSGCATVVVTLRGTAKLIRKFEPAILRAAMKAKVRRFVPDEFGTHTKALDYGIGILFDAKKDIQQQVFASGLEWTLIYPGGIFDYFLPNLRFFDHITTFGDLQCRFPVHSIDDIGQIAARAILDPRAANKAVQMCGNMVSQKQLLDVLQQSWPNYQFEFKHFSSEEITYLKHHSDPDRISAKAGVESDQERYGINYAAYVLCKLACLNDSDTLNASDLYPDYVYQKPEEVLTNAEFVFGKLMP